MVSRGFVAGVAALGSLLSAQDLRSPLYINLDLLKGDPRSATVSYQPGVALILDKSSKI
jgi:hypothetical protein